MQSINNLKQILQAIKEHYGLKEIRPDDHILEASFDHMTYNRFLQIVDIRGKKPLAIMEKTHIDQWLTGLVGAPVDMLTDTYDSIATKFEQKQVEPVH